VQRRNNWFLRGIERYDLNGLLNSGYFVICPKQGLEMKAVALHGVAFREHFGP